MKILTALLLLLSSGTSLAADRYRIDPEHTATRFIYMHWGLSQQQGKFEKHSGWLELDTANRSGAVELQIDVNSVRTGTALFDKTLLSPAFFDAERYPQILFRSTAVQFEGEQLKQVDGVLRIRDTEKAVSLKISHFHCRWMLLYLRNACGANGETTIKRSDFGMGRYAPFVSDEITLSFDIEAIRE
ncbi:YceI family protein [Undibacterium squillarum]|uniref:Polyisoprenoid-binding protein n=1 Tax=Undibacterium squillarum TaxID=1131567 RepID=A0ABQ2Y0Q4_9BURK|nr:YceI family protein [Undibacterium squillarum]GGX47656.1 polyisoprenoid-binding protein [Undibacterium squillarum]